MTTEVKVRVEIPEPHSKTQKEFVRDTHLRQILKAGRRFGKTFAVAIKALEAFTGVCPACGGDRCGYCDDTGRVPPKRVLYAAPTTEQVGKFWYEVKLALGGAITAGTLRKDETELYVERPGTEIRIKARTAWNANMLRGDYADLLILEEFQLSNEDLWDEVGQPMLMDNNGTAIFIYTPPSLKNEGVSKAKDPRHASKMFERYSHDTTGRWKTFHFTSFDNPTLNSEALEALSHDMSLDSYRREILAEDDEIEASWLVYSKFNEALCKIKRFEIPRSWPVFSGHDFGSANPAALFLAQVRLPIPPGAPLGLRFGDYVAFKEYSPGGGYSTVQHIGNFRDITKDYNVEHSVGGNITTEAEIRQSYTYQGWTIVEPPITRVNAQIDRVIAMVEMNKLYVFEDDYALLGQIANCMWELDAEKRPLNKVRDESKYHLLACLRYLASYLPVDRPLIKGLLNKVKVKVW